MYTTTLAALRGANACQRGYNLIANYVGRDYTGPIALETILDNNGLADAIWSLRATEGGRELAVAFAIYCAEPYYTDPAWQEWARKWMSGEDRTAFAAYAAARAVAYAAAYAAADAAAYAARAAARAAADAAAYAAVYAADAADAAYAARAAARAAAYAAAYAARAAADAAADAAAERKRQADLFRKLVRGAM